MALLTFCTPREFYALAAQRLNPGGILVTQSGPAGLINYTECFTPIAHTLGTSSQGPSLYGVRPLLHHSMGLHHGIVRPNSQASRHRRLRAGIASETTKELRYLDGITCHSLFALPRYIREGIASETRTVTDDSPVFMV